MKVKDVPLNGVFRYPYYPNRRFMTVKKVNGTVDILLEDRQVTQLLHYSDELDAEVEYLGQGRLGFVLTTDTVSQPVN